MIKNDYSKGFFAYGGMLPNQKTKVHIATPDGNPLCGVKSNWFQCYGKLNKEGIIEGLTHVIENHVDQNTCKKCLKKLTTNTK
jgi:hypothetical protein